jgi:hypothetical protein
MCQAACISPPPTLDALMSEKINAIASVATAIGVLVAIVQLWYARKLATTEFEDQLAAQYRQLIRELPVEALMGKPLSDQQHKAALGTFLHYFDLSNEQAFLHRKGRITAAAWEQWEDGIRDHLQRPAFSLAWSEISAAMPDSFEDLRAVLSQSTRIGSGDAARIRGANAA